jgi:hypothetical protein
METGLLDRKYPGWAEKISLDTLAMESCDNCILGQLFGSFREGMDALGIAFGSSRGFDRPCGTDNAAYKILADAWRAAIRVRLAMPELVAI